MDNVYVCGIRDCLKPCIITFIATLTLVIIIHFMLYLKFVKMAKLRYGQNLNIEPGKPDTAITENEPPEGVDQTRFYQQVATGVWDMTPPGVYACKDTLIPGYCILPEASAREVCDKDVKCLGFTVANDPKWVARIGKSAEKPVQLVSKKPVKSANAAAAYFEKQPRPRTVDDIVYQPTDKGVWWGGAANVKTGEYTCPDTMFRGYCVVPEERAQEICNKDSGCLGYIVPNKPEWISAMNRIQGLKIAASDKPVMLVDKQPIKEKTFPSSVYYQKRVKAQK
jgi:hypothetical protein